MACQNKHSPQHWIYDCPSKVTVRGVNQVSKNLKGVHNPDYKVFVSGLPFDTKQADLMSMFEHCGKIVQCKLVQFKDTKRCKGNAYIAFDSKENTLKAIKMNGLKQTLKDGKQLTLKVTKALSRALTKKEETKSGKTQNVETTATADVANEEE
jgi:RNA recognition motif-containing protein